MGSDSSGYTYEGGKVGVGVVMVGYGRFIETAGSKVGYWSSGSSRSGSWGGGSSYGRPGSGRGGRPRPPGRSRSRRSSGGSWSGRGGRRGIPVTVSAQSYKES